MIPIKDNYKFGSDPTMEEQIRGTNNWIYKTQKSIISRPSGPVAQRIEVLSLYGSRWALSEDSGFKSYLRARGLLGQKRGAIENNPGKQ